MISGRALDVIAESGRELGTAPADHVVTAGVEAAGGIPALLTGGDLRERKTPKRRLLRRLHHI